jgi:hypothetical protein
MLNQDVGQVGGRTGHAVTPRFRRHVDDASVARIGHGVFEQGLTDATDHASECLAAHRSSPQPPACRCS